MSLPENLDFIIVNYHGHVDTIGAAEALLPWQFGRLWLVDNSDSACESGALRDYARGRPWVEVIVNDSNLGFGRACNGAFERSIAPFFLLLNPDARISAESVRQLLLTLRANPALAGVSPSMFWDSSREFLVPPTLAQSPAMELLHWQGYRFPNVARMLAIRHCNRLRTRFSQDRAFSTPVLSGAVLLLRRSAIEAVGGLFDADFFMFFEDADLSRRLRRGGFGLAIDPAAIAVHEYRHKASKLPLMVQSHAHYFRKHFPRFFRLRPTLQRLTTWGRLHMPDETLWGNPCVGTFYTASDCNRSLTGRLVAWSPSPILFPAIFTASGGGTAGFSDAQWSGLEPGRYMAALAAEDKRCRFVNFCKAIGD